MTYSAENDSRAEYSILDAIPAEDYFAYEADYASLKSRFVYQLCRFFARHSKIFFYVAAPTALTTLSQHPLSLIKPSRAAKSLMQPGIIAGIRKNRRYHDDEPALTSFRAWSSSHTPNSGYGSDLHSESSAMWKAVGECQERFLWRYHDFYSKQTKTCSYTALGKSAIDPQSLAGFSSAQKEAHHMVLGINADTSLAWLPTKILADPDNQRHTKWCPVQLVSNHYARQHVRFPSKTDSQREPLLRWCVTTGLASGSNETDAIVSGILELIERDAFMINYLNRLSPPRLDMSDLATQDQEIADLLTEFERYQLDVDIVRLATDFSVTVLLGIIRDRTQNGPAITVAASADFNLKTAILDTLAETLSVRRMARTLSLQPDFSKPHTFGQHDRIAYWAAEEQRHKLDFFLHGPVEKNRLPKDSSAKTLRHSLAELQTLQKDFRAKKYGLYIADLSSSARLSSGIATVNVISPELHPLHLEESIPYHYSERLVSMPVSCGYTPAEKLYLEPHPFP